MSATPTLNVTKFYCETCGNGADIPVLDETGYTVEIRCEHCGQMMERGD